MMSALDNMLSRLEAECAEQCEAIIKEAQAKANESTAEAKAAAERLVAEETEKARGQAQKIVSQAKSTAQVNAGNAILSAKTGLLGTVLEKSLKKLHTLDDMSYFAVLEKLAEKNILDGNGIMYLNKRDFERKPSDFMEKYPSVTLEVSDKMSDDGFILKYGDIEINCTFPALLDCFKDTLKDVAGQLLFN